MNSLWLALLQLVYDEALQMGTVGVSGFLDRQQ
jgi:hypothetical protein